MRYMSTHQEHFHRKFYLDKKTGYWISTDYNKQKPRVRAHQWVWINIHGKIPKGYHVHHKDENRANNDVSNLELVNGHDHLSFHGKKTDHTAWIKAMHEGAKKWHGSPEGVAWHRKHWRQDCKKSMFARFTKKCEHCGKAYKGYIQSKYCGRTCGQRAAWQHNKSVQPERVCVRCGSKFRAWSERSTQQFCSHKCYTAKRFPNPKTGPRS